MSGACLDLTADSDSEDERAMASAVAASLLTAPADVDPAQQAARRLEELKAALDDSDNEDLPLGCLVANAAASHGAAGPSASARSPLTVRYGPGLHSSGHNAAAAPSAGLVGGRVSSDEYLSQDEAALDAYLAAAGLSQPNTQVLARSLASLPCSPSRRCQKENVQPWCPSSPDAALPSVEMLPLQRRVKRVGVRRRSGDQEPPKAGQDSPQHQQPLPPPPPQQQQQAQQHVWNDAANTGASELQAALAAHEHSACMPKAHAGRAMSSDYEPSHNEASYKSDDDNVELADQQAACMLPAAKRRRTAAAQAAPCGAAAGAAVTADAAAATRPPAAGVKLTAAERAAQRQALKEQKEAEKERAKAAKAQERQQKAAEKKAEKEANDAAKGVAKLSEQCARGVHCEREMVVVVDRARQQQGVCQEAITEIESSSSRMAYCVADLALGQAVPGAVAFAFKRRRLDVKHANETAQDAAGLIDTFEEAAPVPFVLLVFEDPKPFLEELQKERLAGVMAAAKRLHADCSLGVVVVGLQHYVTSTARSQHRKGAMQTCLPPQQVNDAMLQLQLTCPALQLRQVPNVKAAGSHVFQLARQLGKQPYKDVTKVDAGVKKQDSAAFNKNRSALEGRGREVEQFAQTLSRLNGMAGAAVAIASDFSSFGMLISSYKAAERIGKDPTLLTSGLKVNTKSVGPIRSKRLLLLMTSEDPNLVIQGDDADD